MLERLAPTRAAARGGDHRPPAIPPTRLPPAGSGYSDEKIRRLCREGLAEGWTRLQGEGRARTCRTTAPLRDHPRGDRRRPTADDRREPALGRPARPSSGCGRSPRCHPLWIEEPTSPDDVLGPRRDREGPRPLGIGVATGRALPEPGHVQAAPPGAGDLVLPDRLLPAGRRERGGRRAAPGGQVRRARLPPRRAASASASTCSTSRSSTSSASRAPARAG